MRFLVLTVLTTGICASSIRAEGEPSVLPPAVAEMSPEDRATWIVRSIRVDPPLLEDPVPLLVEVGYTVPAHLFEMLRARGVPALDEGAEQIISIYQRDLVREALRGMGHDVVLPAAERSLAGDDDPRATATLIEVTGLVGSSEDLDGLRKRASSSTRKELHPRIEEAIEDAIADLAGSDVETHESLLHGWRSWPVELLPAVLRGVGRARDPRGLPFLTEVLSWHDDLAITCMSQFRLVGASASVEVNERAAEVLRELVESDEPHLCRAALLALGELEDTGSIPVMIELLASDSGMAENALWALRRISRLTLNESPDLWREWFRQEQEWYANEAPRVITNLSSSQPHEVLASIREIGKRRLHRHELARELLPVLANEEARFRALACAALANLGSTSVLSELARALEDAEEEVFNAARNALVSLTGRDLGESPDDWMALVAD